MPPERSSLASVGMTPSSVSNWFSGDAYRIEQVVFSDGTVWDGAMLAAAPILGTAGADTL
ncbi:MAG: calcium-binding protein, partial [Gammaproteobacteria bacterium]